MVASVQLPAPPASVLATSGAKVSVGLTPGSIAALNVTVTVKVPVPTSASVISRSSTVTSGDARIGGVDRHGVVVADAGVAVGILPGRAHRHGAGAGEAEVGGEGRGEDQRVQRGGQAGDGAAGRRNVGVREANRRLA